MDLTPEGKNTHRVVPSNGPSTQTQASGATAEKPWDIAKYREDCKAVAARLSDQDFKADAYPDPLRRPPGPQPRHPIDNDMALAARHRKVMEEAIKLALPIPSRKPDGSF